MGARNGFGSKAPAAPSLKRSDWSGWASASAAAGAVVGSLALWASWSALPWLPLPPGSLGAHAGCLAKIAAHDFAAEFFPAGAKACARAWGSLSTGEKAGAAARLVASTVAACAPAVVFAKERLVPRDRLIDVRGGSRHEGPEAATKLKKKFAANCRARPDHNIAPGVPYPGDLWTRHVLLIGGSGAGKSTVMRPLATKIIDSHEQMLMFDPKGEFSAAFDGPAILAPWDSRSLAWDVAADMRNILDIRRFATAMIRDSSDPMWSNAARQLLVGIVACLQATKGRDWGWRELADLVALPQTALLAIMREHHPEAVRSVERATVTTAGILINLSAFCSPIFDLAAAWGETPKDRRVGFVDWTLGLSSHPQLIIQGHGAYSDLTKTYVEAIVGTFAATINSIEIDDDPERKIWFFADEFPQAGKLPVRALFEVGRSRGVRCVVVCQDLAQLEDIYGEKMVRAIVAMSGTLVVGQTMPGETADKLCKALGSREVERPNVSVSIGGSNGRADGHTLSYMRDDIQLYKPAELASRLGLTDDHRGVRLALFTHGDAYELVWPHFTMPKRRPAHSPAAWLSPQTGAFDAQVRPAESGAVAASPPADSVPAPDEFANLDALAGLFADPGVAAVDDGKSPPADPAACIPSSPTHVRPNPPR
ncbi:ftsK/SpoIIIE family protein [Paraburkholderia fungorum]|uniref:FtsK/SpoIIIE family protein n=1 Tax=Paraburkholderia fungorum TaxID=134537 RepID=A0AAU8T2E9_9BURK|nr:type IV secretion system DNA-binding domain-containing protein [Paraburkholderia fungorum]AJZ60571.1 ftsK/SpoIIIE family protein [Paraburkholderia fungorum]